MHMAVDELSAWIRLLNTPGVGAATAGKLLRVFALPQCIFDAPLRHLENVVPGRIAQSLMRPMSEVERVQAEKTRLWLDEPGHHLISLSDSRYPRQLLEIADPPVVLYVRGRVELLSRPALAIVGSRNATRQGCEDAARFATILGHAGWTIVSGMALGIDAAAHSGGLKTQASTIAVLGTGADLVYPPRNQALAGEIAEAGCLVSEYPLGMQALAENFPRRNRIISGLSRGVLVIEAAARSGSLITAHRAIDQGRDVFAVPGSIHSPLSRGSHKLIREGAKLVETAEDILEELPPLQSFLDQMTIPDPSEDEDEDAFVAGFLSAMGFDPISLDSLSDRLNMPLSSLSPLLLDMEMDGYVERLPGGDYQRLTK